MRHRADRSSRLDAVEAADRGAQYGDVVVAGVRGDGTGHRSTTTLWPVGNGVERHVRNAGAPDTPEIAAATEAAC